MIHTPGPFSYGGALFSRWFVFSTAILMVSLTTANCGGPRVAKRPTGGRSELARRGTATLLDPTELYQRAGLIARTGSLPFVGIVRYFETSLSDSTLVLLTMSMPNSALTFTAEGNQQRASYVVMSDVKQANSVVLHRETRETVRVASFKETTRSDESIIYQQFLEVPPGSYSLTVTLRDEGSARSGSYDIRLNVPRNTSPSLSSPTLVYEAIPRRSLDSVPRLIANPRTTVVFGRDSVVSLYLEKYGLASASQVSIAAVSDKGITVWSDTISLSNYGTVSSSIIELPGSRLGVGELTVSASLLGSMDTVRTPMFVSFGDEWGIAPLEEMLSYLRYYASAQRLQILRNVPPESRGSAWAAFWKETDPVPTTPEHEGLRQYFRRLIAANERFRDEGQGWLTERGMVYITLGEPDQVLEQGEASLNQRGRVQIWQYNQYHTQFVFVDQTGFGRWRLTPSSEAEFQSIAARERQH